jgi:diketogulonate reductase-like aldo/keto reductase
VRTITLPLGQSIPAMGLGTWHLAEDPGRWDVEVRSLQLGIDLGLTLVDTAEMYADGGAEELVGEAIEGRRDQVFLVTKVLPSHATRREMPLACDRSLRRLGTDHVDLYLLHWRGSTPLDEVVEAFDALVGAGKIVYWGVSNFDVGDLEELWNVPGGPHVQTDQVLYNLARRGVEWDLLPWCAQRRIPIMAYSPIEQGQLLDDPALRAVAERHGATPAQVALAWILRHDLVNVIPKAGTPEHVRENRAALDLRLTREDVAVLDRAFAPPAGPQPLATL